MSLLIVRKSALGVGCFWYAVDAYCGYPLEYRVCHTRLPGSRGEYNSKTDLVFKRSDIL